MTTETEYIDLPTLQDVAKAQSDNWEIQYSLKGREYFAWSESAWDSSTFFRGRPRQPKMKEIKMECFLVDGKLQWRSEYMSVLQSWIRQPHLDLIVKVPE
jgi:hypothetical protein